MNKNKNHKKSGAARKKKEYEKSWATTERENMRSIDDSSISLLVTSGDDRRPCALARPTVRVRELHGPRPRSRSFAIARRRCPRVSKKKYIGSRRMWNSVTAFPRGHEGQGRACSDDRDVRGLSVLKTNKKIIFCTGPRAKKIGALRR